MNKQFMYKLALKTRTEKNKWCINQAKGCVKLDFSLTYPEGMQSHSKGLAVAIQKKSNKMCVSNVCDRGKWGIERLPKTIDLGDTPSSFLASQGVTKNSFEIECCCQVGVHVDFYFWSPIFNGKNVLLTFLPVSSIVCRETQYILKYVFKL